MGNHGTASRVRRERGPHDLYVEFQSAVLRQLPRPSGSLFEGLTVDRMGQLVRNQAVLKALLQETIIQPRQLFRDEFEMSLSLDIVWGVPLARMLNGCDFSFVDSNVTDRHFFEEDDHFERHAHRPVNLMDFSIARVKGNFMTWQVIEEMRRVKRYPAGLEVLLAFRRKNKEYPKRGMCVVALGSLWRNEKGYLLCPCMYLDEHGPVLSLCRHDFPCQIYFPGGPSSYLFISVGPLKEES